jgi:hypothetical protein
MQTTWNKRRRQASGLALGLAVLGLTAVPQAQAKDYDIAGTVDCGVPSGNACPVGNSLRLWTDDVTGSKALITIDISWIRNDVANLDQDDPIDLQVTDRPGAVGGIQATGVAGEGSFVDRLDFGVREAYTTCVGSIRAHVGNAKDDDEALADAGVKNCRDLRRKK